MPDIRILLMKIENKKDNGREYQTEWMYVLNVAHFKYCLHVFNIGSGDE